MSYLSGRSLWFVGWRTQLYCCDLFNILLLDGLAISTSSWTKCLLHVLKRENGQLIRTSNAENVEPGLWVLTFTSCISILQPAKLITCRVQCDQLCGWRLALGSSPILAQRDCSSYSYSNSMGNPDSLPWSTRPHPSGFLVSSPSFSPPLFASLPMCPFCPRVCKAPSSLRTSAHAESWLGSLFPQIFAWLPPSQHLALNSMSSFHRGLPRIS